MDLNVDTCRKNIRRIMKEKGLNSREIGALVGIHPITLNSKLNGHNILRVSEIYAIAATLGVSVDELNKPDENDAVQTEKKKAFERYEELRDKLTTMACNLAEKEDPSANEVHALSALVESIVDLVKLEEE